MARNLSYFVNNRLPFFFKNNRSSSCELMLDAVRKYQLYGMVEVDKEVPEMLDDEFKTKTEMSPMEYFSEMSPLFCTTKIPFDKIGRHVQDYVKGNV